jgi:alpha-ribazole phosphatase
MTTQPLIPALAIWRHPLPQGVQGRCIGQTDVAVDPRKTTRLAHRIRHWARCHGAPHVVVTSALQRSANVGKKLAAWGWQHHTDARLNEIDFGHWDGLNWDAVGAPALDAWCENFAHHLLGHEGESVQMLLKRCADFMAHPPVPSPRCVVGHAGWISAAQYLQRNPAGSLPLASNWPAGVPYGHLVWPLDQGQFSGAPSLSSNPC